MGLEMPKLFVVLLDTLPVTGYRIDSDAQGAPPEGDWIPLEDGEVRACQPLVRSLGNCAGGIAWGGMAAGRMGAAHRVCAVGRLSRR